MTQGFEAPGGHSHGKGKPMDDENFVAQIDGQTFLSRKEVDDYYELVARLAQEEQ